MTKLKVMYDALKGFGATTPTKAMTAAELVAKGGIKDSTKSASTQLAQLATTKRGVLARELFQPNPGERRIYRYWVTGEYVGRDKAPAKPKRHYVRRQAAQLQTGEYKLTITGPDMILERTVSNGLLARVINTLIEQ